MTDELKPCPFCGTQPRISHIRDESLWSHAEVLKTAVKCDGCDVSTDYTEEGQDPEAIEKWNTRAAPPAPIEPCPGIEGYVSGGGLDHVMEKVRAMPGWKLVPVEPTDAMLKAVRWDVDAFGGRSAWPSDIWRDMLKAAPPAPAAEKREPLTEFEVADLCHGWLLDVHGSSYGDLVRLTEKRHGITPKGSAP